MRAKSALIACAVIAGCRHVPEPPPPSSKAACAGLDQHACGKANQLLGAASSFGNVRHEYLLDPASSLAVGRGVARGEGGAYSVLPTRCAVTRGAADPGKVDPSTIDFSYVGVSIDHTLVSADVDLAPWVSAGGEESERSVALVAVAFVRELDPQFFTASEGDVVFGGESCSCGRATHFVGSVKMGGLIAYEMRVKSGELRGRALDFVKARVAAGDARVTQTTVGGLEIEGLDHVSDGKPLGFRVKTPVPIAYAVYPLSDVCTFAFPLPDVSPETVDFGEVPYERDATRLVHVVNRASIDLRASLGDKTFAIPALGSADLPVSWRPSGATAGCHEEIREDTIQFYPRDASAPVTPKQHSVRLRERVRTGKPDFLRHEHIDSGSGRKPDYGTTKREWTCPPDYVVASCKTEKAQCGDGSCTTDGYSVNAEPGTNGCKFACKGPESFLPGLSSHFCRFDAKMECRLRCQN
jgi:hypothetical protein